MISNLQKLLICLFISLTLFGCASSKDEVAPSETTTPEVTETTTQSETTDSIYVVYEAIFLDNDEVSNIFNSIRGDEAPFDKVTTDYHVTSAFMPESDHKQWYGSKVNVHISKYTIQEVKMDDGNMTSNEGLKVELTSENVELNEYLISLNKNFHITGSYKDAAKYTDSFDFSDGEDLDIDIKGTFGGFYSDGNIYLENN